MLRFMMTAVRELGQSSSVYLSTPDGRFSGAAKLPDGTFALWVTFPNLTTCEIPVDPETLQQIAAPTWCDFPYNSTNGICYQIVDPLLPGDKSWTPIYWLNGIYETFSVSSWVQGRFFGVVSVDWILGSISQLLNGANTSDNGAGICVLMERDSELFLGSTDASISVGGKNQTSGLITVYNVSEIALVNDFVRVAQDTVLEEYGTWAAAAGETFWSVDGSEVVSVTPIKRVGLEWLLVVVGRPTLMTVDMKALGTVLGITVAFVVLAIFASCLFSRPINLLSEDMTAISQLDFSARRTKKGLSRLREVRDIQTSFLRLRTGARALTRYVPSEVALDVMRSDSGELEPDMKLAPLTILFTDLKGFTSLSETLPHDVLVSALNHWFQEFGTVIHKNGGTIDKFIGDCIMALYGAPSRVDNPELAACRSAFGFRQAIEHVNSYAALHGVPPLDYRVGIHTGQVLVGHLGYSEHVNYTVCGNAANVASRMEQLGKEYGITPLVSGDVAAKVSGEFLCVFLDVVFLRGHKTVRTRVFHLLSPRSSATPEDHETVRVFDEIHGALCASEPSTALGLIAAARAKPFLSEYRKALLLLRKHVRSGTTCKESYIETPKL